MSKPTIIVTGAPTWLDAITDESYILAHYTDRTAYVTRLAETRAAMIVVDGTDSGWRFWTTTPKSSPATRRIPVIVVAAARHEALLAGADFALTERELIDQFSQLVRDYARIPDPAYLHELECGCADPLPPLAVQGVEKFNAGEYYPQHDLFEEQWVNTETAVRDLYRAILQVGVAYYQIERGNHRGALKMLLRSVQWLLVLPDVCQGVDVQQLRADATRVRAALEAMDPADIDTFDRRSLKPLKLVDTK